MNGWQKQEREIVIFDGRRIRVREYRLGQDGSIQFRTAQHSPQQSEGYSRGGWRWA